MAMQTDLDEIESAQREFEPDSAVDVRCGSKVGKSLGGFCSQRVLSNIQERKWSLSKGS